MIDETIKDKIEMLIPEEDIEEGALFQINSIAILDETKKMAVMPDVHFGYTLAIGGVALMDGFISPAFVGYDIGCGMCYIDTGGPVEELFKDEREKRHFFNKLYEVIPMGVGEQFTFEKDYVDFKTASQDNKLQQIVSNKIAKQLGSLGGGNHFIELGVNKAGHLTVTIHSGSRGAGWQTADYYMKIENEIGETIVKERKQKGDGYEIIEVNKLFRLDSEIGQQYEYDMEFFLQYALDNRADMMIAVLKTLGFDNQYVEQIMRTMINKTHNHAEITPDGVLHRKGATSSYENEPGVIPGNMRDGVFIVNGLGNSKYLNSSSHGAGRTKSRKQAKRDTTMEQFESSMEGIVAKVTPKTLDESAFAYKDIEQVMERQEGIVVDVVDRTKPIINIKA